MAPPKEPEDETGGKAESILAAAKQSFLARGFGAVSMDAIARAAGVSKATVYAHFTSKEELFGAVIGRECESRFAGFSAHELDPDDVAASLLVLGRRFLELILSPDAIALHRIILGEVSRFPLLGEVFWHAGPERNLAQIEAFMRRAAAAGTLALADTRCAAEQFVGLVRGESQLRQLLQLEPAADSAAIDVAAAAAVATFLRAFRPAHPERDFYDALSALQGGEGGDPPRGGGEGEVGAGHDTSIPPPHPDPPRPQGRRGR